MTLVSLLPTALALGTSSLAFAGDLEAPVRLEADGAYIDSGEYVAHSGPLFHDVSGDGLPDLLVGNFKGHVQVFHNVGTRAEPRFEGKGLLEADGEKVDIPNW